MMQGNRGTEVRMHGIGDHDYLSSLGTPPLVATTAPNVEVALPPVLPEHRLRLVNWSRTTRRSTGLLWHLAFPFTLVNVAGHMTPETGDDGPSPKDRVVAALLAASVWTIGLLLTLQSLVWLVAIGETWFRKVAVPVSWWSTQVTSAAIVAASGAIVVGAILGRQWVRTASRVSWWLALPHIGCTVASAVALIVWRPGQREGHGWPTTEIPLIPPLEAERLARSGQGYPIVVHVDVMTVLVAGGVAIALAFATVLVALSFGARYRCLAGAALLLLGATVLLNSAAALLRTGCDWLSTYFLQRFAGLPGTLGPFDRVLLPYDNPIRGNDFRVDLVPLFALAALLAFLLALVATSSDARTPSVLLSALPVIGRLWPQTTQADIAKRRQEWVHRTICELGRRLPVCLAVGFVFWVAVGVVIYLRRETLVTGGSWVLLLLTLHLGMVIVLAFLLTGQPAVLKEVTGLIADVAGFWPVRCHPLAGVSYRPAALEGIRYAVLDEPRRSTIVLVGHSQGSVLCAWYIAKRVAEVEGHPRIDLVTCGSPLRSLYAAFFPAHFSRSFFHEVELRSRSWRNYWRCTDPIATPLPGIPDHHNVLLGGLAGEPASPALRRGHGDYWLEKAQCDHVRECIVRS